MTQQLENELERVLRSAGESAPRPDPNLVRQIDDRGRRRRAARVRTAAACVAAVAAIGVAGVASGIVRPQAFGPAGEITTVTGESERGEASTMPLAEKVWPDAVHRIPQKLPDGRKIFPVTFLDARTLLIATQSSFEKADSLYRYDIETAETEELVAITSPGYANDFTVAGGWVVWRAFVEKPEQPGTEIWGVPLSGGPARRLVVAPGTGIDFLAVGGEEVHWSYGRTEKEVYSAPLSGDGQPKAIPESKGFHIVSWPWIGSPGEIMTGSRVITGNEQELRYRTLRNVTTGETRTATVRKGEWSCGISWCVGTSKGTAYRQQRDGDGRSKLPAIDAPNVPAMVPMPVRDRFLVDDIAVVDLHTGKAGRLSRVGDGTRMPMDNRLHFSDVKNGYELIDLAAID